MEGERCTMHIDFYSARFTAYQPKSQGNQEFCEELPDTGLTLFVLDYLHPSLKLVPVDFRIIRNTTDQGPFALWEDVAQLGDLEPLTLFYQSPTIEADASLQLEYEFAEPGEYIGIVTAGACNIELGVLKTESPVGRGASGWPGTSPGHSGAGPGQESMMTASASGASISCACCAAARCCNSAR